MTEILDKMKKQKIKKHDFFKRNYVETWEYIKESKNFIYSIILLFIFFTIFGFILPVPAELEVKILEFIEQLLKHTEGLSQRELINFIFWNNFQSSLIGMLFGIFFGVFSVISAIANGYLLGFVASRVTGINGFFVLWRLFPHGIFELPALFISLGLGLRLGTFILEQNKIETLKNYLIKSIKVFLFIILPLLIFAAIIEGSLIFLIG